MANSEVDIHFNNVSGNGLRGTSAASISKSWPLMPGSWRCYRTLHFIACRVLGGPERSEEAIGSCWRIASRHPQRFEHEGELHSWLLRVLIDEALVLLLKSVPTPAPKVLCEPVPAWVFRSNDVRVGKSNIRTDDQNRFFQDFSMALNSGQTRLLEEGTNLK